MKPSLTSHILRKIVRELQVDHGIDHSGLYVQPPEFPSYSGPDRFRAEWLGYNIARKREVDRPELEEVARAAFQESEAKCYAIEKSGWPSGLPLQDKRLLISAAQIMRDLLGDAPPVDWYGECEFTGGASTSRNRSESHPSLKWFASKPLDVTPLALPYLLELKASCEVVDAVWGNPGNLSTTTYEGPERLFYKVVPGSRLNFVEKNYKTKRTILIEPDGNMVLQKGLGNVIRRRLRRVGINLNSQRYNQILAYAGSISGSLGTIDIAAASDSVTLALLRVLLPWKWYELIYATRSPVYHDGSEWKTMRKVSSMGNGYTFELESAVFYCLALATIRETKPIDTRIAIFGDDIIIASESCDRLAEVLKSAGFETNVEKSFWKGPFRESCGKHYYHGTDVTPVYLKEDLDCLSNRFRLYNQLREWAGGEVVDPRYSQMLEAVLGTIPIKDRRHVPVEYGELAGLHYPDVCSTPVKVCETFDGTYLKFDAFVPVVTDWADRIESELAWLYQHVTRWQPSCPIGTAEYTPLTFVTEGKREWQTVSIPYASVTRLIA